MEIIFSLLFSKLGAIVAAVGGVLFLLWRKKRAETRAAKAEAALEGQRITLEAAELGHKVDEQVKEEVAQVDQDLAGGDLESLLDKYNRGDGK